MKTTNIFLAAAVAAGLAATAIAETIAYWDFSSDALGVTDVTGNYDLANGGVTISDGAAVFDGTAKALQSFRAISLATTSAYTIECFVKTTMAAPDNGIILELSPNFNANFTSFMLLAGKDGGVTSQSGNGKYNGESFTSDIADGQWHHVAVIVNPAGETAAMQLQLYVDKVRQGVRTYNSVGTKLASNRLYIGSRNGASIPFKGQIDDVRISRGVLSTDDFIAARTERSGLDVRAYWRFEDGDPLADSSGNGNTLQGSRGVAFSNGCASFDGTESDVRTSGTLDLSAFRDVTVECFARPRSGGSAVPILLEHSANFFLNEQGFYISLGEQREGAILGNFCFKRGSGYRYGQSPAHAVDAGWHHIALVKDSSRTGNGDCVSLYIDGILMEEMSGGGDMLAANGLLRDDYLYIGSRANSSNFADADIDDVRITAQVLQPGQFLKTRTGLLDDVIAYWPFKSGSRFLEDATGNGNALAGSGATAGDDGAAVFDGSSGGIATLSPLPLYPYDSVTIEFYMKSSVSASVAVLETSQNFNNAAGAFGIFANSSAGFKTLGGYNVLQNWALLDGNWHHYALVHYWSSTTYDFVRLYRDGERITSYQYSDTSAAPLRAATLYIGARAGTSFPFTGELDDVRITGRALTPQEFLTGRSAPEGLVVVIR